MIFIAIPGNERKRATLAAAIMNLVALLTKESKENGGLQDEFSKTTSG